MGKHYSNQDRQEALKLAKEIGNRATSERLGINLDTLYTWISKDKKRKAEVISIIQEKGTEGLIAENEELKKELLEKQEEIDILQGAVSFFVKHQKKQKNIS